MLIELMLNVNKRKNRLEKAGLFINIFTKIQNQKFLHSQNTNFHATILIQEMHNILINNSNFYIKYNQ